MNNQRILIAAAWLVTVAAAYFIGSSGDSARNASPANPVANGIPATQGATTSAQTRPGGEGQDDAKSGRPNVASLIARARMEMGGSMGGMMNIRGMLRAVAPIAELDDSQIQEALVEVERSVREPQQRMMFYSLLLGQWAETDGRAALAYAEEKMGKSSPFDAGITASVLGSWAHRDPEDAWKWFQNERKDDGNDRTRSMAASAIFSGMAANNLDAAIARLSTLDEQTRGMAMAGIAGSATDDASRQRLLARATSMPLDQRLQIQRTVASQWAMSDADAAVNWIHSLPPEEQNAARESAGNIVLMINPALGSELMMEGADEKQKPRIYDRIVTQWAQQDARAAGEWLTSQTQGPELDGARRSFARTVASRDPAAAMDWARSVQDEKQRTEAVGQVFNMWRAKDSAAAEAALIASGLPPEKVKQFMETNNGAPTKTSGVIRTN